MKNLFDLACVAEVTERLDHLQPDSVRLWGTMTAPRAMAHCAVAMEWAVGDIRPKRMFTGRLLGGVFKRLVLGNDSEMRRNSPTAPGLVVADDRDLASEQTRLRRLIERFAAAGPAGCTTHPHSFFGRLTPDQWAELMYKHLDHHLRQFGV